MLSDTIYVYSDASFSKAHEVAMIGYAIFTGAQEHEAAENYDFERNVLQIQEVNNIRAEIKGAIAALKVCPGSRKIILYSDCQALCRLPLRREKLEAAHFISQSKNRALTNADLYQEFYLLCDRFKLEIVWIKGHSPGKGASQIQRNFSYLDKAVRRRLRKVISTNL